MKKKIIITGAGRGIGKATAILAASQGHEVLAISRNIESLIGIKNIQAYSVDLSNQNSIASFFNEVKITGVDALINNAGKLENIPFTDTSFDVFESVFKVNVFGLAEFTRQLLPHIKTSGHVVNISSMGGVQGSSKFPGLAAYSSSKGAVITLTELLAEEYKETGPSFNALAFGAVQTEMLEEAFPGYKAPLTAEQMGSYLLNFALTGHEVYNGKTLPVSSGTP
ncbi:SDR family oxidoreductase [Flavobacteriaceae bacterium]|uniref:SDR family NAD(P)-dependent oxidoreductase n=1 Tax=Candidatus Arcticimaribacter forsetii TaxID=2820661 RepID=UPI00207773DD|nr:SDR family oxidoreductase [Candidatus Arcticimaribacter forsetii]MCH1539793.1 SDR family oxidoreductase [Flavobacteriaceae bacterium]MDA8639461.1 SDR family oxidoreductase [Flavobacteriaceae bacterium]MDA8698776.1 SDR family oxidoreductase [Flavobacteriaceae bacterium]MDB2325787.1 SDR family oxidoreductase [Flavobacteriaceae bacterium]MDB4620980.1 SDR family oxidoreductase [Flavobacteriaceae bacterium]